MRNGKAPERHSLCSLPVDLIYVITSFADWNDILALGQTSHRYREVVSGVSVWVNAAQDLARRYKIPLKTFDYDTLSIDRLQHLVAQPTQIRTACRTQKSMADDLALRYEREYRLDGVENICSTALVPGGRWVITGHRNGELSVWDLNAAHYQEDDGMWTVPRLHRAKMDGCQGQIGVLLIQRSEDTRGVIVLTEIAEQAEPFHCHLGITYFPLHDITPTPTRSNSADRDQSEPSSTSLLSTSTSNGHDRGRYDGASSPQADAPFSKIWSPFTGNDTIALEGAFVAAEHHGLTRVWNWKRQKFTAYRWEISVDGVGIDDQMPGEHPERVDISIQPPYVYLLSNTLRVFAAFKIPPMSSMEPYGTQIPTLRPSLVVNLDPTEIIAVQFINPWTVQGDYPSPHSHSSRPPLDDSWDASGHDSALYDQDEDDEYQNDRTLPFFVNALYPDPSINFGDPAPTLFRYDVTLSYQPGMGVTVQRPILKQRIRLPAETIRLDIISPTVVADDFATFWVCDEGLAYMPDRSMDPILARQGYANGVRRNHRSRKILDTDHVLVAHDSSRFFTRHKIGMDVVSGRRIKVTESTVVVSEYALAHPRPRLNGDGVETGMRQDGPYRTSPSHAENTEAVTQPDNGSDHDLIEMQVDE